MTVRLRDRVRITDRGRVRRVLEERDQHDADEARRGESERGVRVVPGPELAAEQRERDGEQSAERDAVQAGGEEQPGPLAVTADERLFLFGGRLSAVAMIMGVRVTAGLFDRDRRVDTRLAQHVGERSGQQAGEESDDQSAHQERSEGAHGSLSSGGVVTGLVAGHAEKVATVVHQLVQVHPGPGHRTLVEPDQVGEHQHQADGEQRERKQAAAREPVRRPTGQAGWPSELTSWGSARPL